MNPGAFGADLIGGLVGFVLTIFVFSYLFGDNILFRIAIYLFIGVAAGFAAVIVFYNVILAQLLLPLIENPAGNLLLLPPMLLGLWLLLTKVSTRLERFGSPSMAYLVGVAAAAAIGGVLLGTLFPQMSASSRLFSLGGTAPDFLERVVYLLQGGFILLGTITTLIFFHFTTSARADGVARRPRWLEALGQIGQVFIIITFGTLFAGVYAASLTALIERLSAIIELFRPFLATL